MSAARHISDAELVAMELMRDLLTVSDALRVGIAVTADQLAHLQRASRAVLTHVGRAKHDLSRIPQVDQLPHGQTVTLDGPVSFVERRGANGEPAMVGRRIDDPPITLRLRDLTEDAR